MACFLVTWAVAAAVYVLFAGQFSADELVAAAICGLAASLWAALPRRVTGFRFRFERGAWSAAWRAAASAPAAIGKVAFALLKTAAMGSRGGDLKRQPFVQGRLMDPEDAGRRAVAVLARSFAPDSFVVRVPEGEDSLDLHELVKTAEGDPRWAV